MCGSDRPGCRAIQQSDQMCCSHCGLVWDMNDDDPPECKQEPELMNKGYRSMSVQHDPDKTFADMVARELILQKEITIKKAVRYFLGHNNFTEEDIVNRGTLEPRGNCEVFSFDGVELLEFSRTHDEIIVQLLHPPEGRTARQIELDEVQKIQEILNKEPAP